MIALTAWRNRQFEGHVRRGQVFTATPRRARELERLGRAIPSPGPPPPAVPRRRVERTEPLRLALLMPVWRRRELTKAVLSHYARLRGLLAADGLLLDLLVVGSEGAASEALALGAGARYVEAPNSPLSFKFQAGITALRGLGHDAVVIVGSDDLMNAHAFDEIGRALDAGHEIIDFRELYIFDLASGRLVHFDRIYIGAGRVLARVLLDRLNWQCWRTAVDKGVDMTLDRDLGLAEQIYPIRNFARRGVAIVDVKSESAGRSTNLWSLETLMRTNGGPRSHIEPRAFFDTYFPEFRYGTDASPTVLAQQAA